ncbi:MAG: hypothetical protein MJ180_03975 [Candidatus Gastranaerophilales bacterium]|nr:hypothetical protein [Candidatus Gastranaerophilales bacterium]
MRTSGILLLMIIFLTGCGSGQPQGMVKRESKVHKLMMTQKQLQNHYTLNRTAKGVYVYTDRPKSTNVRDIFISDDDIINN